MGKRKLSGAAISVVLHSAQLALDGGRLGAGDTATVGADLSAARALELLDASQASATDEVIEAGLDVRAELEKLAQAEAVAVETLRPETPLVADQIDADWPIDLEGEAATQDGEGQL